MMLRSCATAFLVFGLVAGISNGAVFAAAPPSGSYRADRLLIKPLPGIDLAALDRFHASRAAKVLRTFDSIGRVQILELPPSANVPELIADYQRSGLVEYAEPDFIGHIATIPNDPKYLDGTLWGLNAIDASDGWSIVNSASNIVVAVLDTGVRYTHQDLASNMWVNPNDGSHGTNAIAGTTDPNDDNSHGTLVAGVLGAVGNNGKGVVGVAWKVQIMACKCFYSNEVGTISDVISCLDYARANGANVVNASWGFNPDSQSLSNAMLSMRDSGIMVAAACGNSTNNIDLTPSWPSSYRFDNIVSVAATTQSNTLSSYSNFSPTAVQLGAPGDQIYSTWGNTGAPVDSLYAYNSGTSFAAPYVAGALALLRAKYPSEPYQQNIARLLNGTDPLPSLSGKTVTGGRLNLYHALNSPIRLVPIRPSTGSLGGVHLLSAPNRTCVIQSSGNFTNWSSVVTNTTSTNGTLDYFFQSSSNAPAAFYRAVSSM